MKLLSLSPPSPCLLVPPFQSLGSAEWLKTLKIQTSPRLSFSVAWLLPGDWTIIYIYVAIINKNYSPMSETSKSNYWQLLFYHFYCCRLDRCIYQIAIFRDHPGIVLNFAEKTKALKFSDLWSCQATCIFIARSIEGNMQIIIRIWRLTLQNQIY